MKKLSYILSRILCFFLSFLMILSFISFPSINANAESTVDDFVERCYLIGLGRASDPDGFAYWKGKLTEGEAVGIEVAYGFLFSKEYLNKGSSNDEYLNDLYKLFMDRSPDKEGYDYWMNKLESGYDRLEIFAGFANSLEFYNICESYGITAGRYIRGYDRESINNVNLFVERLYKTCFGRIGDMGGQNNWVEKLLNKEITGAECARCFIFSKEYSSLGLSDEEFVENLYLAIMGRPSDVSGKTNWIKALESGKTRDEVFEGFVNSTEFDGICKTYGINRGNYTAQNIGIYKVGDIISIGKYEQDGDLSNGPEDIEWQILGFKDGNILVISKYSLDSKPYNDTREYVTWETCTLRKWLNEDFYNTAFSDDEKSLLQSVTLKNDDNPYWNLEVYHDIVDGGNDTIDKLFCLSLDELEYYFGDYNKDCFDHYEGNEQLDYGMNQNALCTPTQFAINNNIRSIEFNDVYYESLIESGVTYTEDVLDTVSSNWWLRTPGSGNDEFLVVYAEGIISKAIGINVNFDENGVRPAMYIKY